MSTTYSTAPGDTFEIVSRKCYGVETNARLIASSNPGIFEPLAPGLLLFIPRQSLEIVPPAFTAEVDEVNITIGARRFRFWDGVTFRRSIDTVDTLELTSPFDPDDPEFREAFKPFSYPAVNAWAGSELLFTGTMTTVKPAIAADGCAVAAGAYSLPGVLADCCAPAGIYANGEGLEFTNATLPIICKRLLEPFGLEAVFVADPGKAFDQVSIKPTENVLPFLAKLAKMRGLVITSNARGQVVFWQSNPGGNPVAVLTQGLPPLVKVSPEFKTQDYYSHITGIEPNSIGAEGGQQTERNQRLPGVLRPFTFEARDASGDDLALATRAKMGRMFGDAVVYTVELSTWRTPSGGLWMPNDTLMLTAPGAMVYTPYEFLIRDVEFRRTSDGATASLSLVVPAAYRGQVPERMPWEQ